MNNFTFALTATTIATNAIKHVADNSYRKRVYCPVRDHVGGQVKGSLVYRSNNNKRLMDCPFDLPQIRYDIANGTSKAAARRNRGNRLPWAEYLAAIGSRKVMRQRKGKKVEVTKLYKTTLKTTTTKATTAPTAQVVLRPDMSAVRMFRNASPYEAQNAAWQNRVELERSMPRRRENHASTGKTYLTPAADWVPPVYEVEEATYNVVRSIPTHAAEKADWDAIMSSRAVRVAATKAHRNERRAANRAAFTLMKLGVVGCGSRAYRTAGATSPVVELGLTSRGSVNPEVVIPTSTPVAPRSVGAAAAGDNFERDIQDKEEGLGLLASNSMNYVNTVERLMAAGLPPVASLKLDDKPPTNGLVVVAHFVARKGNLIANNNNPLSGTPLLNYYPEMFLDAKPHFTKQGDMCPIARPFGVHNRETYATDKQKDTYNESVICVTPTRMYPLCLQVKDMLPSGKFTYTVGTQTYADTAYLNFQLKAGGKQFMPYNAEHHLQVIFDTLLNGESTRQRNVVDRLPQEIATLRQTIRDGLFNGMGDNPYAKAALEMAGVRLNVVKPLNEILEGPGINFHGNVTDRHQFILVAQPKLVNNAVDAEYWPSDMLSSNDKLVKGQFRVFCDRWAVLHLPENKAHEVVAVVPQHFTFDTTCHWPLLEASPEVGVGNRDVAMALQKYNAVAAKAYLDGKPVTYKGQTFGYRGQTTAKAGTAPTGNAPITVTAGATVTEQEAANINPPTSTTSPAPLELPREGFRVSNPEKFAAEIETLHKYVEHISWHNSKETVVPDAVAMFATNNYFKLLARSVAEKIRTSTDVGYTIASDLRVYMELCVGQVGKTQPVLHGYKWKLDHVRAIMQLLTQKHGNKSIGTEEVKIPLKEYFRLEEGNGKATIWMEGKPTFTIHSDGTVIEEEGKRAFQNTVIMAMRDNEVAVRLADPFSNFMKFLYFGFLPLLANSKGQTVYGSLRANAIQMLNKMGDYTPVSKYKLDEENGGSAYAIKATYAPVIATRLSPYISDGIWIDLPAGAKSLASAYAKCPKLNQIKTPMGASSVKKIDMVIAAQNEVTSKYYLDYHYSRGCFMLGLMGHMNIGLLKKKCPSVYANAKRWLAGTILDNDEAAMLYVCVWTIKFMKGMKRATLGLAQSAKSVDGKEVGYQFYGFDQMITGSLTAAAYAVNAVTAPGIDGWLEDPSTMPAAEVFKTTKNYAKRIYKMENGHPFNLNRSSLAELRPENGCAWTWVTKGGWTYGKPSKSVTVTRGDTLFVLNPLEDKHEAYDASGNILHESFYRGELKWVRFRTEVSLDKKVSNLVVEYQLSWIENSGKDRGAITKSQKVAMCPGLIYNEFNPSLEGISIQSMRFSDGIKDDVIDSYVKIAANCVRHNAGNTTAAYRRLYNEVVYINKVLGKETDPNDPVLVIEPASFLGGLYDGLIKAFQDIYTHQSPVWFDWRNAPVPARTMYELYTDKVRENDGWAEIDASRLASINIDLEEGQSLVVYHQSMKVNKANAAVTKMFGHKESKLDAKTCVLVFVTNKDGSCERFLQRASILCGRPDLPLYSVDAYESSTVQESVSTSVVRLPEVMALGLAVEDAAECTRMQHKLLDAGREDMYQLKTLAAFDKGHPISSKFKLITAVKANNQLSLNPEDLAYVQRLLVKYGVNRSGLEANEADVFKSVCAALTNVVFRVNTTVEAISDLDDDFDGYDDDIEDYGDDFDGYGDENDNEAQAAPPSADVSIWLPGLYAFSRLKSNSEANLDFVSKLYHEVIKPMLLGKQAEVVDARSGVAIMRSLLRAKNMIKLMNGRRNLTAKRVALPDAKCAEVHITYSTLPSSVYQTALRAGIPVDRARAGEEVYVLVNRAPLAAGYVAILRIRENHTLELEDGTVKRQQYVLPLCRDSKEQRRRYEEEPSLYILSEIQFGMDFISVYMDGGDFDGDGGYLTWLEDYRGTETSWSRMMMLRNSVLSHPMLSAKCDSYAADHFNIKPYAGKADQTLYSGLKNSIKKALVTVATHVNTNRQSATVQSKAVGAAYSVYMIGFHLTVLACAIKAHRPLSAEMDILTQNNSHTLVMLVAEMYEVLLGGYSIEGYEYFTRLLKDTIEGNIFDITPANLQAVYAVLIGLGSEVEHKDDKGNVLTFAQLTAEQQERTRKIAAVIHLTSHYYAFQKTGVIPVNAELKSKDNMRWVAIAMTSFELNRGNFNGFNGVVRSAPMHDNPYGQAHKQGLKIAFDHVVGLGKDEALSTIIDQTPALYSMRHVYNILGNEMALSTEQYLKVEWTDADIEHFNKFSDVKEVEVEAVDEVEEAKKVALMTESTQLLKTLVSQGLDINVCKDHLIDTYAVEKREMLNSDQLAEFCEWLRQPVANFVKPEEDEGNDEGGSNVEPEPTEPQGDDGDGSTAEPETAEEVPEEAKVEETQTQPDMPELSAIQAQLQALAAAHPDSLGELNSVLKTLESINKQPVHDKAEDKAEGQDEANKARVPHANAISSELSEKDDEDFDPSGDNVDEDPSGDDQEEEQTEESDKEQTEITLNVPNRSVPEQTEANNTPVDITVPNRESAQEEKVESTTTNDAQIQVNRGGVTTQTIETHNSKSVNTAIARVSTLAKRNPTQIMPLVKTLNEEQSEVLKDTFDGKNLVLTGKGGAGKSYTVQVIRRVYDMFNLPYVLVGSTGASVVNVEGDYTFNSMFGLGLGFKNVKKKVEGKWVKSLLRNEEAWNGLCHAVETNNRTKKIIQTRLDKNKNFPLLVIVDEISMVDSLLLSAAHVGAQRNNVTIQWLLVGDPCQLEPVDGDLFFKNVTIAAVELGKYVTIPSVTEVAPFKVVNLQNNVRAAGDKQWADDLDMMRFGRYAGKKLPGKSFDEIWERSLTQTAPKHATHLMPTNFMVRRYNEQKTKELTAKGAISRTYTGTVNTKRIVAGQPKDYWLYPSKENRKTDSTVFDPIGKHMTYCVGMPVQYRTFNIFKDDVYEVCNGMTGVVVSLKKNCVVVDFDNGPKGYEVKAMEIDASRGGLGEGVGSMTQIPLCPAFAITYNKSQGLTFNTAIVLHLYMENKNGDINAIYMKNLAYVGFSRATSSSNVWIAKVPNMTDDETKAYAAASYRTNKEAVAYVQPLS